MFKIAFKTLKNVQYPSLYLLFGTTDNDQLLYHEIVSNAKELMKTVILNYFEGFSQFLKHAYF